MSQKRTPSLVFISIKKLRISKDKAFIWFERTIVEKIPNTLALESLWNVIGSDNRVFSHVIFVITIECDASMIKTQCVLVLQIMGHRMHKTGKMRMINCWCLWRSRKFMKPVAWKKHICTEHNTMEVHHVCTWHEALKKMGNLFPPYFINL